jgi:predicted metalloprotease with PDZ domain
MEYCVLALDLSLRMNSKSLDGYMKMVWEKIQGKSKTLYNCKESLAEYMDKSLQLNILKIIFTDSLMRIIRVYLKCRYQFVALNESNRFSSLLVS